MTSNNWLHLVFPITTTDASDNGMTHIIMNYCTWYLKYWKEVITVVILIIDQNELGMLMCLNTGWLELYCTDKKEKRFGSSVMCRVLYMLQYAGACANTIVIVVANRVILIRRIAHFSFELFPFFILETFYSFKWWWYMFISIILAAIWTNDLNIQVAFKFELGIHLHCAFQYQMTKFALNLVHSWHSTRFPTTRLPTTQFMRRIDK